MRKGRRVLLILFILFNIYAILCGGLYFFQENLIFLPNQLPQEFQYSFETPFEEVNLTTVDDAKLNGIYFKNEKPDATLLYFHGNAGDLSRWGDLVQFFVKKNIDVVVMDYRNFGKSKGAMSEQLLYQDSDLWYHFANERALHTNTPLYVYGRSMGSTFATFVAANHQVKELILEAPFYSVESVAKDRFPMLPVSRLLKYKFPTYAFINKVSAPITIFHGTDDNVVNYNQGKRLFESIKSPDKQIIAIENGGHNDLSVFPDYQKGINTIWSSSTNE